MLLDSFSLILYTALRGDIMFVAKLTKLPVFILAFVIFLLPLINLPWTPDQVDLNKQMFIYAAAPLLGLSLIIVSYLKPSPIKISLLDGFVALFCLSFIASSVLASSNRWESVMTEGLPMLSLLALYILIRQVSSQNISLLAFSLLAVTSISSLIVLWQQFVTENTLISPVGSQGATPIWYPSGSLFTTLWLIAISFPLILGLVVQSLKSSSPKKFLIPCPAKPLVPRSFNEVGWRSGVYFLFLVLSSLFLVLLSRPLLFPSPTTVPPVLFLDHQTGWKIFLGSLYSSPLLGVGPGNFIDAFTNFKPPEFNNSPFWNTRFITSSNFPFYLGTTTGLVGLTTYLLVIMLLIPKSFAILKNCSSIEKSIVLVLLLIVLLQFLFPAPFLLIALFLILVAVLSNLPTPQSPTQNLQPALTIPLTLVAFIFLLYAGTTHYQAEVYAQKAAVTLKSGEGEPTLKHLEIAEKLAPYRENYFVVSSQINLAIAGNILAKTATVGAQLSQNDTQLLQSYIKVSLDQAKKPTELSPKRSSNWENLAKIYRRVANIVQGAFPWIISSYQKAIDTDPTNPRLLVEAGGVYFGEGQYATASALFRRAVDLKPDYNNAHYNLAHALFQLKNYQDAVSELDKAIALTNPSSPDYVRAKAELELFKTEVGKPLPPPIPPTPSISTPSQPTTFPPPSPASPSSARKILISEEGLNVATQSSLPASPSSLTP